MPTRYSRLSVVWVAPAVSVAWVPWEALRLPTSPVVPVVQAASTMPVEPVDPTGLAGQGVRAVRVALMLRGSCQRAVALVLPELVVPWQRVEPPAAVELQVVSAQLALPVQPVAAGHEAAGAPRVPWHLEQLAESEHLELPGYLVLLERSELQGRWVLLERSELQEQ